MNKISIFLFISTLFFACSLSEHKKSSDTSADSPITTKEDIVIIPNNSGIVPLSFTNGKASVNIQKKETERIVLEFDSPGHQRLQGQITSLNSSANIRFNQIILPDSTMDGPFGRNINYDLPIEGCYRLILGESLMAGDPWGGTFKVEISLSNL